MGESRKYRWETRKAKQSRARSKILNRDLFSLQCVLLTFIFFLWIVGARIIMMIALTTTPCIEAAARFGANPDGPSVFEQFLTLTQLGIALWLVLSLTHWRALRKIIPALFHGALLGCLVFLHISFFHLTLPGTQAPDGYLNVKSMVLSAVDGKAEYNARIRTLPQFEQWVQGTANPKSYDSTPYYQNLECVWNDKGLVSDLSLKRVDEYAAMTLEQRWEWSHQYWALDWKSMTRRDFTKASFKFMTTDKPMFQSLQEIQTYRPMHPRELARFNAKQACLSSSLSPDHVEHCQFTRYIDWTRTEKAVQSGLNRGPTP